MGKRSGNFKITKRNKKTPKKEVDNTKRIVGYCNDDPIYGSFNNNNTYINYDKNIYEISLIKKKYSNNNFPKYDESLVVWGTEKPYSLIHVLPQLKH